MKKNRKFSGLFSRHVGGEDWELTQSLTYYHKTGPLVVPVTFVTNRDSVPRIPVIYALFKGRAVKSAVVHDYLYELQYGKAFADGVFLDAMKDEGVLWVYRYPIYWAVVLCGGGIYANYRKQKGAVYEKQRDINIGSSDDSRHGVDGTVELRTSSGRGINPEVDSARYTHGRNRPER